ncbi:hypothetical protein [Paraferrimonas sedimenticola]|uniref:Uncharacterized protein n=1 Tax=Paraferrimonas sedimenticola TaxID=375674 RepID=A0AA37RY28_9GAMM|nr:hypothetical protein [Paraferrimonas sedimenticola]GLP96802.1 hypothetical protein GCM10007895_21080 [Paraferrimonas sedimenticola]
MTPEDFISNKAPQLAYYGQAAIERLLPESELQQYLWETLQEWAQYQFDGQTNSKTERVFWHLLFELHQAEQVVEELCTESKKHLLECCQYLSGSTDLPNGCIGVRPEVVHSP